MRCGLFVEVYKRPMVLGETPRPKKEKKLPAVLSTNEIRRIVEGVKNLKHRALLMLTYSGGLRVGEVVRLKVNDIDEKPKLISSCNHKKGATRKGIGGLVVTLVRRQYDAEY